MCLLLLGVCLRVYGYTGSLGECVRSVKCVFDLFLAVLGLGRCVQAFSSCDDRGCSLVQVRGCLITVASLVRVRGPNHPTARGIFLDQGRNLHLLHWQVDS